MSLAYGKIIPLIGIISSGKSTFLQALVNSDILETGGTTTTKFPCLIKNIKSGFKFYKVKICPKDKNRFIKDGEVILGEEKIRDKIKEINRSEEKNVSDLFYVLECKIFGIENKKILEENYFMDVPGLNESKCNYVKNIFENIKDLINFYIFIFNVQSYVGDETKNIFKILEENGCLQKKEGNLFLLNKIDNIKAGTIDTRVEEFSNYFYNTFEKEEFKINKYKNTFIPLSSISYKAELSIEKFSSFLIFHLIKISQETNEEELSFIEKLKNSVDNIFENDEDLCFEIKKLIKNMSKEEKELILSEIEKYNQIKSQICYEANINSNINMKKREQYETIYKLFYLNKQKKFPIKNSSSYLKLKDFFNNQNSFLSEEEKEEQNQVKRENIDLLERLTNFVSDSISAETFKGVGEDAFTIFRNEFQAIKNNLLSEKLRIAFIGSISVGKSSIINCLIGEEINPTKSDECTYRGVIYRYHDCDEYKLYKTELKSIGEGIYEYLYFIDEEKPYCRGIRNIKDLLNNKNRDKKLTNKDSFIVITGRIRIFDLLNISKELKNKIEIIDLPGYNRASNQFIQKPIYNVNSSYYEKLSFYEKILCFSNVCVFINKPENLDDEGNVAKIKAQYIFNKRLLHPKIQQQFNESCLFIINQIDILDKDTPEEILKNKFRQIIEDIDQNADNLTISCFSAYYYLKYIEFEKLFKEQTTDKIEKIWQYFYEKYNGTFFRIFRSFGKIIISSIEKYESYFKLYFSDSFLDCNCEYKDKIIMVYSKMENLPRLDEEELNEIASHLYNFYLKLNDNNYKFYNVRKELFIDIENKINNANKLISKNYFFSLQNFFDELDPLFEDDNKELKKEDEKNIEEYINKFQKESIPVIEKILDEKRKSIIKVFSTTETKIKDMIDIEKGKVEKEIKKNKEEIKADFINFNQKVEFKMKEMEKKVNEEFNNLGLEIKDYYDNTLKSVNKSFFKYEKSLDFINNNINKSLIKAYLLTGIKFFSLGSSVYLLGSFSLALLGGALCVGVGGIIYALVLGYFNYNAYSSWAQEYFDQYNKYKENVETNIFDAKDKVLKNFDDKKEIILKQLNMNLQGIKLRLHASNDETYEKKCREFKKIKNELQKKLQEKN